MDYSKTRLDTKFLRFLAILFITNSHLDNLYPVPYFGVGGSVGNSLFFMLSGFGLALSFQKKALPFHKWYPRRILRIYPSYILYALIKLALLAMVGRVIVKLTPLDLTRYFVWPTSAWFIGTIMALYIVLFAALRTGKPKNLILLFTLFFIPYAYFYLTYLDLSVFSIERQGRFNWIFYQQMMLLGGYLAVNQKLIKYSGKRDIELLALFFFIYVSYKILNSFGYLFKYQALIHIITFPIVFFLFRIARAGFVERMVYNTASLARFITFMSAITLEIYLIQYWIYSNGFIESLSFPINMAAFWFLVIVSSFILMKSAGVVRRSLQNITRP
jgi:hypothetical protein